MNNVTISLNPTISLWRSIYGRYLMLYVSNESVKLKEKISDFISEKNCETI